MIKMEHRSVVFIDGENVVRSWMSYCKSNDIQKKVDYVKLVKKVSEGTDLLRAYFYDGVPETIPLPKKNFLTALQRNGIQLRTKILKNRVHTCSQCNYEDNRRVQKGVDVSLATDILRHAWQQTCNICIVVSGDEDYKDAVDCIKDKGLKVWVVAFKNSLSTELRGSADKVIFIEDIFNDICKDDVVSPLS